MTKLKLHVSILALLAGSLGACTTHLTATPEDATTTGPSYGIPYRLPMKQFELAVTWELKQCLTEAEKKQLGLGPQDAGLGYEIEAVHTGQLVEGESIVMDYREMTNSFKTGKLDVSYWYDDETKRPLRFVKSINGTIEGKEPEALKSGIGAITNIAKTVLTLSSGGLAAAALTQDKAGIAEPDQAPPSTACTVETLKALAELKTADAQLKELAEEADSIAARLELLKVRAILGELTEDDKAEIRIRNDRSDELAERVKALSSAQAVLRRRLSYTQKFAYPATPAAPAPEDILALDREKTAKWLRTLLESGHDAALQKELNRFQITASLVPVGGDGKQLKPQPIACPTTRAGPLCPGYVYREPVAAQLTVTAPGGPHETVTLVDSVESIPQLGRMRILPLRSRWGEKNGLSAEFSIDGTPTRISYDMIEAGGPKMLAAAEDASASALDIATLIAENRLSKEEKAAEKEKAQIDALQRQIDLAEKRKKLDELKSAPAPQDPTATALTAELAILRMQKEKAELLAAMRAAEAR
ncbi:MAG TPA: hypothetical protein VGB62_03045 [Allosphingosinicella sp.]|jgi:hypothetical protein